VAIGRHEWLKIQAWWILVHYDCEFGSEFLAEEDTVYCDMCRDRTYPFVHLTDAATMVSVVSPEGVTTMALPHTGSCSMGLESLALQPCET
jgi:hypothetical protein